MQKRDEPTVAAECPAGGLVGLDRGETLVFKGIRYAAAGRFAEPQDVASWDGRLDATSFRAQAPQVAGALEAMLGGSRLPTDEDCLHLNVTTPGCDARSRPVLFWVHGGAYTSGGGAMPWYDGSRLAARGDVVVVTINYRLGALGFLGARNSGIRDQISALRWVARNISAFGGDPGNVTIFGESAGGSAVVALADASEADHLFHRTFAMSPSLEQFRTLEVAERSERAVLDGVGVAGVDALTRVPLDTVMATQEQMLATPSPGARTFSPTGSSDLLPGDIVDGAADDERPLVIGTTRDEAHLFSAFEPRRSSWTERDVERHFGRVFGDLADEAIAAYSTARPASTPSALVSAMETDEMFRAPARRLADARATRGNATWMYSFDYSSPAFDGVLGSCHALDIPFVFDNLHRPGVEMLTGSLPDRQAVADRFSDELLRFARSGAPSWQRYRCDSRPTQRIGLEPDLLRDPEPELRRLWEARTA